MEKSILEEANVLSIIEDYYWGHYAAHNEDEAGLERWLEKLSNQEIVDILHNNLIEKLNSSIDLQKETIEALKSLTTNN